MVWDAHLRRRPPQAVEILLAELLAVTARVWGGESAKNLTLYSFAPWLMTRAQREEAERLAQIAEVTATAEAYEAARTGATDTAGEVVSG